VLQKYLNANDGDVAKAADQLWKTLEWRAKMKPLDLLKQKFDNSKFGSLGYVTSYSKGDEAKDLAAGPQLVFTWNIYGSVKSIDETFGSLSEFIPWRVALMELALQSLNISSATKPISSNDSLDPYKIFQVHDYKSISFFRQSPQVKAASTETIKIFAQNYPELLKEKFFLNVSAIMGFLYGFIKLFVAEKTRKKFHPMSNGGALNREFESWLGKMLPKEYGGEGPGLEETGTQLELE
jgi:phosphatidylinositol transfer protein SFH5